MKRIISFFILLILFSLAPSADSRELKAVPRKPKPAVVIVPDANRKVIVINRQTVALANRRVINNTRFAVPQKIYRKPSASGSKSGSSTAYVNAAPPVITPGSKGVKSIKLYNVNTRERGEFVFWRNGHFEPGAMAKINYFLRDHRSKRMMRMDPNLIALVHQIAGQLRYNGYIKVISAYRSRATNEEKRRRGSSAAKNSQHIIGRAMDIRMDGIPAARLRDVAIRMKRGGVGYYPRDGFVHVDTGPVRSW